MALSAEPAGDRNEPASALLVRRVRGGVWTLIIATVALAAGELFVPRGNGPSLTPLQLICLVALITLLLIGRRVVTRRATVCVGVAAMTVACVTSVSAASLTGNSATPRFVLVAIAMGGASLIPWGWWTQGLVVGILMLTYLGEVVLVEGALPWARGRELLEFAVVLAVSVYIADEFERYRRLAEAERLQRRRREEEIEEQHAFLRQIIDINPHFIFARDRAGRFTLVNQAVADAYGSSVEELIGKTDSEFNANAAEVVRLRRDDETVMNSRQELLIPEEVITDAGGRQRWLRTIKRPIVTASGEVNQVLGVATDITEQRVASARIEEEAQIGSTLAHVGREIIAALSSADLLERICRLAIEALRCQFAQMWLLQAEDDAFVPVAEYGSVPEKWEATRVLRVPRVLLQDLMTQAERDSLVMVTFDDVAGVVPALGRLTPDIAQVVNIVLRRGGEISGSLAVAFVGDQLPVSPRHERIARGLGQLVSLAIENARLLDQLNRANQLKTEFMATMSHELRTPLNVILGYTGLLLEGEMGEPTPAQADSLRRVEQNAGQLLDLINATLDVSRLEAGDVPLDLQDVELRDCIAEIDARTAEIRSASTVHFAWHLPPESITLRTDVAKLKVMMVNLIANAFKFTATGSVTGHVSPHGDVIEFAIVDTGIGIAPEAQAHIFEPFRQADSSIGSEYGGVGLGLYIVTRLAAALGGTITVESVPGQGSTFRVRIPLHVGTGDAAA